MRKAPLFASFAAVCILATVPSLGQTQEILAVAAGRNITLADLSAEGQKLYREREALIASSRSRTFSLWLAEQLIGLEAKARNSTADAILKEQRSTVTEPDAARIQTVYDANRGAFGARSINEVRPQIVDYLRREAEQEAVRKYIESLQKKFSMIVTKDVNAAELSPSDVVATIGNRPVTLRDFETANKIAMHNEIVDLHEHIRDEIETAVLNALVEKEAVARSIDAGSLIAAEITNRMREYSDDERVDLEYSFQRSLFNKYKPQILFKEPPQLVLAVSTDDDPSIGPANAPVTVVMFSDFQCPACARTHPVLKRVINEYPGKVRLVIRDFPLLGIHDRAIHAARAANAAHAQGKFVEYIEMLYRNQDSFDDTSLRRFAEALGLNMQKFAADIAHTSAESEIMKDVADGESYGVSGTPTIFVNGISVHKLSAPAFRRAIESALAAPAK